MSGRVVGHDCRATNRIDVRGKLVAYFDGASLELAEVGMHRAALQRVAHEELRNRAPELARIADLAAGFRIERCAVEHDLAFVTRLELVDGRTVLQQRDDPADVRDAAIAQEVRLAFELDAGREIDAELTC